MNLTVNQRAPVAQDKGYEYFAVQSVYGECLITVEERRKHVQQIQEKSLLLGVWQTKRFGGGKRPGKLRLSDKSDW